MSTGTLVSPCLPPSSGAAQGADNALTTHRVAPLSNIQRWIWRSEQSERSIVQHATVLLRLHGQLNRPVLRAALDRLVSRHESMRTVFRKLEDRLVQVIGPADSGFPLTCHEVDERADIERISHDERSATFDLATGPLIRGRLLHLSDHEHVLMITQHRLVADRWSAQVLLSELGVIYLALAQRGNDPLPPLELQYAHYANLLEERATVDVTRRQLNFWKQTLLAAPEVIRLPQDKPATVGYRLSDRVALSMQADVTDHLQRLAHQTGVSLLAVLLSGWGLLLSRWGAQREVTIGIWLPNRRLPGTEAVVGAFENIAAIRVELREDATIEDLVRQVEKSVADASENQDVTFEQVLERLHSVHEHNVALQVMLRLDEEQPLQAPTRDLQHVGLRVDTADIEYATTKLQLSMSLSLREQKLAGVLEYAGESFERETIERIATWWDVLLAEMTRDARQPISRVQLPMTESDRERLLGEFNDVSASFLEDRLIHELFEECAAGTPDAGALTSQGRELTYAELNERANQLAHYLCEMGAAPGTLVGVCLEAGIDLVVALLAVMKAGGAYVPLDPNQGQEWIDLIIHDSAPAVLLTQKSLQDVLPASHAQVILLDADSAQISAKPKENLALPSLSPQALAYVVYVTDPQAGPAGVMVEHRNVTRSLAAIDEWFHFDRLDTWPLIHSAATPGAALELWGPLTYGSRLVAAPSAITRSHAQLHAWFCREGITVGYLSAEELFELTHARAQATRPHALRTVVLNQNKAPRTGPTRPGGRLASVYWPRIAGMYGTAETTGFATYYPPRHTDAPVRSAGEVNGLPLSHARVRILDSHRQLVPIGACGEVYVGGAGVARGYLNRPDLTRERFCPDPFSSQPAALMYRTGDLGRWRSDGTIEWLSRRDQKTSQR